MARKVFLCLVGWLGWLSLAAAQSMSSGWGWEFVASHVSHFEEKKEDNHRMLVVEVLFRNNQAMEQKLIVAKEAFQAVTEEDKPIEILGLLFKMQDLEGARSMAYTGGMKRMETLKEVQEGSSAWFLHSPGPVEVIIAQSGAYKQRLLLIKPDGGKPFRLKFTDLPALEVTLPQ